MRRVTWRFWIGSLISLVLLGSLSLVVVKVVVPQVIRWQRINQIGSPDPEKRRRSLAFLARHIGEADVLEGALRALGTSDEGIFLQIQEVLDARGRWRHPPVAREHWLRWIAILVQPRQNLNTRAYALERIDQLPDAADDPAVAGLLASLAAAPEPALRRRVLLTAAALWGQARDKTPHEALVRAACADGDAEVSRQAWILLGLIDPGSGLAADWQGLPSPAAGALLWAALATNPDQPEPALRALRQPTADPAVRAMAAYALHPSRTPAAQQALLAVATTRPARDLDAAEARLVQRAILAMDLSQEATRLRLTAWAQSAAPAAAEDAPCRDAVLAAAYRLGLRLSLPPSPPLVEAVGTPPATMPAPPRRPPPYRDTNNLLALLAYVDGLPEGQTAIDLPDDAPGLCRVAAAGKLAAPTPTYLEPVFFSPWSNERDLACLLASRRFSLAQNDPLVRRLLGELSDEGRASGAILAGLTGLRPEFLADRAEVFAHRPDPEGRQLHQLMQTGQWMQGSLPAEVMRRMDEAMPLWADNARLPMTSLFLAMLHRRHPAILGQLLDPRHPVRYDLVDLFARSRWWPVLQGYLPGDAPPIWPWADEELLRFQVQVLRSWYLLHRERIEARG